MKTQTKIAFAIAGAAALGGAVAASQNEVVREYGVAEGIDQVAHYLWGYALTNQHMLLEGKKPCDAIQETMDFAVKREFWQKKPARRLEGKWCHDGCRRDLEYWTYGTLTAAFDNAQAQSGKELCRIVKWKVPAGFRDETGPLINTPLLTVK